MYPAYLQVTDIAGLIKGASQGEGLGNAFLSHIQAVDGMFHVVRYNLQIQLPLLHTDSDLMMTEHSITIKFCMSMTRLTPSGTWVSSAKSIKLTQLTTASSRYNSKRALQEGSRFVLSFEIGLTQAHPLFKTSCRRQSSLRKRSSERRAANIRCYLSSQRQRQRSEKWA